MYACYELPPIGSADRLERNLIIVNMLSRNLADEWRGRTLARVDYTCCRTLC